jgi:hypothetical protein
MLAIRPQLSNYKGFLDWVSSIRTKLDNYDEGGGSGSVVLFIESLSINMCRFKRFYFKRGEWAY